MILLFEESSILRTAFIQTLDGCLTATIAQGWYDIGMYEALTFEF
jgi:hypothetical protein